MYTACLFYYTILLESRERDPETTDTKKSSYRPHVLVKDTEQHCRGKLNQFSFQRYLPADFVSLYNGFFFSVRQITMTVRKFRPKTDDYTEGKSCFYGLSEVLNKCCSFEALQLSKFLMTDLTIKIPFLYHLRLNS